MWRKQSPVDQYYVNFDIAVQINEKYLAFSCSRSQCWEHILGMNV